jgi:hypothetical protein
MSEPIYAAVSPLGEPEKAAPMGRRAASLAKLPGSKIGLLWTAFSNGDIVLEAIRSHLQARFPDTSFVELMPGRGKRWDENPDPSVGDCARELQLDAAIVTAGC